MVLSCLVGFCCLVARWFGWGLRLGDGFCSDLRVVVLIVLVSIVSLVLGCLVCVLGGLLYASLGGLWYLCYLVGF